MNLTNILTAITSALNWFPGLKTKAGAVAAFALALVAAYNSLVAGLGHGTCTLTPEQVAAAVTCASDWSFHVPDTINVLVMALIGVGAANQPKNNTPAP